MSIEARVLSQFVSSLKSFIYIFSLEGRKKSHFFDQILFISYFRTCCYSNIYDVLKSVSVNYINHAVENCLNKLSLKIMTV